jgi:hypothetical protein
MRSIEDEDGGLADEGEEPLWKFAAAGARISRRATTGRTKAKPFATF